MKKDSGRQVHFTDIYEEDEKIGEVKYDGFRLLYLFTALDQQGFRIFDCSTREKAEQAIRLKFKTSGQNNETQTTTVRRSS